MKLQSSNEKEGKAGMNNIKEKTKEVSNYTNLCWDASGIHSISVMHSLKHTQETHLVNLHFSI